LWRVVAVMAVAAVVAVMAAASVAAVVAVMDVASAGSHGPPFAPQPAVFLQPAVSYYYYYSFKRKYFIREGKEGLKRAAEAEGG
jgi:hypothetical protein